MEAEREEYNQKWLEAERELSIQAYELAIWVKDFICDPEELLFEECLNES